MKETLAEWNPVEINGKAYIQLSEVKNFYQFDRLSIDGKKITLERGKLTIKLTSGEQTMLMNGLKFFLSEPVRMHGQVPHLSQLDLKTLISPLLKPDFQKMPPMKTIIIDPGHGGMDKGAAKLESAHTLALALELHRQLQKKGYKVVLTRELDVFVPLGDRIKMANTTSDAIFISLHYNSSANRNVSGFESYILSARQPRATHTASLTLATDLHSRCLRYLNDNRLGAGFNITDRGIRRARFNLLSGCKHPTVIIEAGFLTNKAEAAKISTLKYRLTLANAITRGIDAYRNSLTKHSN
ncbi:MAG: N-acetylmuramoyl-L-alanine amidase [Akkermansiaceae bacterium]